MHLPGRAPAGLASPVSVAASPGGKILATRGSDGGTYLWSLATGPAQHRSRPK
jgi:hypothetical protein